MTVTCIQIAIFVACCYATSGIAAVRDVMQVSHPYNYVSSGPVGGVAGTTMRVAAELRAMERRLYHYVRRASVDGGNREEILSPAGDCCHAATATYRATAATPRRCDCIDTATTVPCCHVRLSSSVTTTAVPTCCRHPPAPETGPSCCGCTVPTTAARCGRTCRPPTCSCATVAYSRICTTRPPRAWSITSASTSAVFSRPPSTTACRVVPSSTCITTACGAGKMTSPSDAIQNRWPPITADTEWLDDGPPSTMVTCQIRRTTTTTTTTCRTTCATELTTKPTSTAVCSTKLRRCTCTRLRTIRLRKV